MFKHQSIPSLSLDEVLSTQMMILSTNFPGEKERLNKTLKHFWENHSSYG